MPGEVKLFEGFARPDEQRREGTRYRRIGHRPECRCHDSNVNVNLGGLYIRRVGQGADNNLKRRKRTVVLLK